MRSWSRAGLVVGLLTTLYALLYSLLQLEDYALLMGTALLLVIIAVLMYLTRNLRAAHPTSAATSGGHTGKADLPNV